MSPLVAIVTLNWNGWEDTTELIASLNKTTYDGILVIVVDNASTNNSVARMKQSLIENKASYSVVKGNSESPIEIVPINKHFLLVESETNLGFCAGNNLGMKWAVKMGAKYSLILNNDTLVSPDFLQPLIEIAENNDNVGLLGGVITYCEEPDIIWWAGGSFNRFLDSSRLLDRESIHELKQQKPFETEWVSGCMMMIPTHIYTRYGGYVEEYFIWSEEWDYSLMISRAGFKLIVVPQSRICHKVGRSLGIMTPLNYYYGVRNGILLKRKYLPRRLWYLFLLYYLPNRLIRYTQLFLQRRGDLVHAGTAAVYDGLRGKSGKWQRQNG